MKIQQILGLNIKQVRDQKSWSQDKLSEVSGLHRTYISGIERGVRNPTVDIVQQIAEAFDVHTTELFKDVEK
jgi:transcriptional regulator with XRE-family HTH domain